MSELTTAVLEELRRPRAHVPARYRHQQPVMMETIGAAVPVPPMPSGPERTVRETLESRRSTRLFGAGDVAPGIFFDSLAAALMLEAAERTPYDTDFEVTVLAFRIAGLPAGIYRFNWLDRLAEPIAPLPSRDKLLGLTLQQEFCHAAAIVSLSGNLHEVAGTEGAHGYRRLMGRAAEILYQAWLEGIARGLVGSVFAGFIPASIRDSLRSDGAVRHQLFALALGLPVHPETSG